MDYESQSYEKPTPDYMVWNVRELLDVCTQRDFVLLSSIIERINKRRQEQGTETSKGYIVLETDAPYAKEVKEILDRYAEEGTSDDRSNNTNLK